MPAVEFLPSTLTCSYLL